jgi:hypothetical protein
MVDVRPDEISAILRAQITGFNSQAQLEEEGTVLEVGDGIARVYGLSNVLAGELVEFTETGIQAIALNLEEDNVGLVLMGASSQIKEGDKVKIQLTGTDPKTGKLRLSRKVLMPKPDGYVEPAPRERREGGDDRPRREGGGDRRNGGGNDRPRGDRPQREPRNDNNSNPPQNSGDDKDMML